MAIEIDHIFVACSTGAPEADILVNHGFQEGSPNTHPGQGTANRRFFFENFMLELIWVENEEEARSEFTQPTHLWERCSKRRANVNPFGFVFRPTESIDSTMPLPTWKYRPQYLPPDLAIEIATGTSIAEPGIFYLPFLRRQDNAKKEPVNHALPLRNVKRVEVGLPDPIQLTNEFKKVVEVSDVRCFQSVENLVHIVFEGDSAVRVDLRPSLPVILMTGIDQR